MPAAAGLTVIDPTGGVVDQRTRVKSIATEPMGSSPMTMFWSAPRNAPLALLPDLLLDDRIRGLLHELRRSRMKGVEAVQQEVRRGLALFVQVDGERRELALE